MKYCMKKESKRRHDNHFHVVMAVKQFTLQQILVFKTEVMESAFSQTDIL